MIKNGGDEVVLISKDFPVDLTGYAVPPSQVLGYSDKERLSVTLEPCEYHGVQGFAYVVHHAETDYDLRFVESTPRNFEFIGTPGCPNYLWRAALTAVQLTAARHDIQTHIEYLAQQGYELV